MGAVELLLDLREGNIAQGLEDALGVEPRDPSQRRVLDVVEALPGPPSMNDLGPVVRIVHRVITGFLIEQAGLRRGAADAGSVTLIQRFGSAANLNIHLHCLVLDGVYRRTEGEPVFDAARAPTGDELAGLLEQIVARLMKLLTRSGYLVEEQGMTWRAETEEEKPRKALCADEHGFSLHAAVRLASHQREDLERLCGTITGPALANERLSRNARGQVVLRLKSLTRDGTTQIVMHPQAFMQRLAALVPRPRLHMPLSRGARPEREAACGGDPAAGAEGQRTGAGAHTWPGGPDALGTAAEARVPHRCGALRLRWAVEDPRRDRRAGGDREDPHAPGPARAGVLARLRSLTEEQDDGSAREPTDVLGP